ncbi:hypothetical protein JCM3770_006279 [Rhodotorula araucariae]
MDLDALRKAALSSKKRKRTPQPAPSPAPDDEREEGEIDDEPAPAPPLAPLPAEDTPYHIYTPAHRPTTADRLNTASLHAVKEESKRIIAELLSYGVPPDYLLSIGISRDILEISFSELGLSLTLPPLYSSHAPYSLSSTSLSANAHPFTPRSSASPVPHADLAALEALKRQELLARKAALKARNAQSAQSLESELEGLFSATPSAGPSLAPASPTGKGKKKKRERKKRKTAGTASTSPAQKIHDLREAIDHTEEVVDVPSPGPFAAAPAASSSSIAAASTRSTASFAAAGARTRPLATDFEAEPASVLPSPSGSRGPYTGGAGGMGFLAGTGGEGRMVIDLSDSDESGDEDTSEDAGSSPTGGEVAPPSVPASKAPSPAIGDVTEAERKKRLEDKEREIQRMMERIAEMERRKKEGKGKRGEAGPSAAEKLRDAVEEAVKQEGRDEDATSQDEQATLVDVQPTPQEEDAPEEDAVPAPAAGEVFRPYTSSLARYPLIRALPPASDVTPHDAGNAGLASWVARKRGVDSNKRLCKAEAGGGRCHDDKCKSTHVASFVPTADELVEYQSRHLLSA